MKSRFLFLLLFLSVPVLGARAQDYSDSYPKNTAIDVQSYVFELTFSDETDVIEGRTTVDARFVEDGQSSLRLDLIGPVDGKGMTVSSVTGVDGELAYTHADNAVTIDLGGNVPAGQWVRVHVTYSGIPASGLVIGPNKYGDRTFFSDNWSSRVRNWLPTVDHPYDKATTEMIVTAPGHYRVNSNGTLKEETDLGDGRVLTHWVNPVPTATWLYFVGVARFAMERVDSYGSVPIETWVYWQDRDAGFYDFAEPSKAVLAFYSDLIGPYVNDRLANIVSNGTPGGGMEAASTPAYADASVSGNRERRWQHVIIHEIAHQWFGNAVTEYHWNDVWLSEGFATYYTLLFREHHYGHDDFVAGVKDARQRVINFYRETPDFQLVRPYIEDLNNVSGAMMYQKGAWVLHMLRNMLGDEVYNEGIRSYYAAHMNSNAQTADLREHLEAASGMDLAWYFDQWVFQGGIPVLEGSWKASSEGVHVQFQQTQDVAYQFDFPIDVEVVMADGSTVRHTVDMPTSRTAEAMIPVDGNVVDVVLDPDSRLLADWTFGKR